MESEPDAAAASAALLLADARLPTGGHTQSGGLEPALLAGLPEDHISRFLRTRLRTSVRTDAACAALVLRDLPLDELIDAWNARTPSQVVREAAYWVARGYLRVGATIGLPEEITRRTDIPRPIALGLLAQHWKLSPRTVARLVCHEEIQTITAAALKLAPFDPAETVVWALGLADDVQLVVNEASSVASIDQIPASSAPQLELWQHAHQHNSRRLFRA